MNRFKFIKEVFESRKKEAIKNKLENAALETFPATLPKSPAKH